MTIQELIYQPQGYVSDFYGLITGKIFENKTKDNKPFWNTTVADESGGAEIKVTFWDFNPSQFEGGVIHFTGKNMKLGEYQGNPQLAIGKGASLKLTGGAAGRAPVVSTMPQDTQSPPRASEGASRSTEDKIRIGMIANNATRLFASNPNKGVRECVATARAILAEAEGAAGLSASLGLKPASSMAPRELAESENIPF